MHNLEKIRIDTPARKDEIIKTELNKNEVLVEKKDFDGNLLESKTWFINSLAGQHSTIDEESDAKNYELKIAWNKELDDQKNVLYSFFKTKIKFKFPALVHGTFELSSNRNNLEEVDGHNEFLFKQLAKLLIKTALLITKDESADPYLPLMLTYFNEDSIDEVIKESGFIDEVINEIKENKLFPTVHNTYISFQQKPVFYFKPIAKYLISPSCKNLLLHSDQERIINLFKKLPLDHYPPQSVLRYTNESYKLISKKEYTRLLLQIIYTYEIDNKYDERISEIPHEELTSVLVDKKDNFLDISQPIFLPPEGKNFTIPEDIDIQFVDEELANLLLQAFQEETFEVLAQKIACLSVRAYNPYEMIRILQDKYNNKSSTTKDIKQFIKYSYKLLMNEIDENFKFRLPQDIHIILISKNNKKVDSRSLHLTAEYGHPITEQLLAYDKTNLIGTRKQIGLESEKAEKVAEFLIKLNVSPELRFETIDAEEEYGWYSMRHYDFKYKINDLHFRDFKDFKKRNSKLSTIRALSIHNLSLLLKSASSELIISWIFLNKSLTEYLKKDNEPSYDSRIGVYLPGRHHLRFVYSSDMKSYIKWTISNTEWLTVESGEKAKPKSCSISPTINIDFSPLINKPVINYDHPLFRKHSMNKNDIDYILLLTGVHKSVSTMETASIYSILLRLLEIDPEGKKARPIYRELANNYKEDSIDEDDNNFKKYKYHGMVFSRLNNGQFGYVKYEQAYYVDNKKYGESIINQYNCIQIERRKNKSRIEKLFGVKPLEALELRLSEDPIVHPIQNDFQKEMDFFKAYVYAQRMDLDTEQGDRNERNQIKSVKFILSSQLSISLLNKEEAKELSLQDYEFIYLDKSKEIYIQVPEHIESIQKLQNNISFCMALEETFSALLDIDAQTLSIRELFSKDSFTRDEILRNDMDDHRLTKLEEAKRRLDIISDSRSIFWSSVIKCFPRKKIKSFTISDEKLIQELEKNFPDNIEKVRESFFNINYENYNDIDNLILVEELFQSISIDIPDFNKYSSYHIDIRELHKQKLNDIKLNLIDKFKKLLYLKLTNQSLEEKLKYTELISKYKNLTVEVNNSIQVHLESLLFQEVSKKFNINLEEEVSLNLEQIYSSNKVKFIEYLEEQKIDESLAEQFIEENNTKSLLLFNEIDYVAASYKKWIMGSDKGKTSESTRGQPLKRIEFGREPFFFSDFNDLKKQLDESDIVKDIKIKQIRYGKHEMGSSKSKKGRKRTTKYRGFQDEKTVGFLGEYLVYTELLEKEKSVKWVSEYAKMAGIDITGEPGDGYDLTYVNQNGKRKYVEVKVIGPQNSFPITANEVRKGEEIKNDYEIMLVRNCSGLKKLDRNLVTLKFLSYEKVKTDI